MKDTTRSIDETPDKSQKQLEAESFEHIAYAVQAAFNAEEHYTASDFFGNTNMHLQIASAHLRIAVNLFKSSSSLSEEELEAIERKAYGDFWEGESAQEHPRAELM